MTVDSNSNEHLELYKLHAELADRVSQRREGANRLYAGLLTGLVAAVAALVQLGPDGPGDATLVVGGIVGIVLSMSWYVVIRSYRQLNSGKFKALQELEENLVYPFFTREWKLLKKGKDYRRYWKLTIVETTLPIAFFVLSIGLILAGVLRIG